MHKFFGISKDSIKPKIKGPKRGKIKVKVSFGKCNGCKKGA
jgi:hypothetical protein